MDPNPTSSTTILDRIIATKRVEVSDAQAKLPLVELVKACERAPAPRGFRSAIDADREVSLIAEVKKASPSRGLIRADFDPVSIAKIYQRHGAACLSVLTDESYFQGHLDYLRAVREAVNLPVLRKDFVIDPYQVYEARAAGADAVLLIAECLDDDPLRDLRQLIEDLGMDALVEFYDQENLTRVVESGARLIGVNNRDLRTFETDLGHALRMRSQLPDGTTFVAESGIRKHADVVQLKEHDVHAMLVGESLMAADDIGSQVEQLLGRRE